MRFLVVIFFCSSLAFAADDFPCWRGVHGSGTAHSGAKLVDDISLARLLWKSEYVPGVYGSIIQTGNSGVSVADGKVVLVYHWPNDDVYDEEYAKKMVDAPNWPTRAIVLPLGILRLIPESVGTVS